MNSTDYVLLKSLTSYFLIALFKAFSRLIPTLFEKAIKVNSRSPVSSSIARSSPFLKACESSPSSSINLPKILNSGQYPPLFLSKNQQVPGVLGVPWNPPNYS